MNTFCALERTKNHKNGTIYFFIYKILVRFVQCFFHPNMDFFEMDGLDEHQPPIYQPESLGWLTCPICRRIWSAAGSDATASRDRFLTCVSDEKLRLMIPLSCTNQVVESFEKCTLMRSHHAAMKSPEKVGEDEHHLWIEMIGWFQFSGCYEDNPTMRPWIRSLNSDPQIATVLRTSKKSKNTRSSKRVRACDLHSNQALFYDAFYDAIPDTSATKAASKRGRSGEDHQE